MAIAPPRVLTRFSSIPSSLSTLRTCTANASLISMHSIWSSDSPARFRAFWTAGTGPMPISSGFTPTTAMARMLASGLSPSSRAFSSDMIKAAADPTLTCELLPAVTDPPSGWKAGASDESASSEVSRRKP